MKKLCFILVLAFMFISIGSMNVNAQSEYCNDSTLIDPANCFDWDDMDSIMVVVSSLEYSACEIKVLYNKRRCIIPQPDPCPPLIVDQVQLYWVDWDWVDCGGTGGLTPYIWPGYPNDFSEMNDPNFRRFLQDVQAAVSRYLFDSVYNSLNPGQQAFYQCEGDPCVMPQCSRYKTFFTDPKCVSICEERVGSNISMRFKRCGNVDNLCCFHTRTFCYCPNGGGYVMVSETTSSTSFDCSAAIEPPAPYCPEYGNASHPSNDYRVKRTCMATCD